MAIGASTFTAFGGAVSDLFAAEGYRLKGQGAQFEKQNYLLAAGLAQKNVDYTVMSTAIKQTQLDRQIFKTEGAATAGLAGSGLATSGSGLDVLRDSAQQGALAKSVLTEQGFITAEGYREQAQSYRNMASAADIAIQAAGKAAEGAEWSAGLKFLAAGATLIP